MLYQETLKAPWEISGAGCGSSRLDLVWVAIPMFLSDGIFATGTDVTGTDVERVQRIVEGQG